MAPNRRNSVPCTDKGRAIKGLIVCNNMDLEPLDLQNGLSLGFYQPSPEVLIYIFLLRTLPSASVIDLRSLVSKCWPKLYHNYKDVQIYCCLAIYMTLILVVKVERNVLSH